MYFISSHKHEIANKFAYYSLVVFHICVDVYKDFIPCQSTYSCVSVRTCVRKRELKLGYYLRYVNKASAVRSPARDSRGTTISRSELSSRSDRDKRKEPERRLCGSREKTHDGDAAKRARTGEHNSEYHHSSSRGWSSKEATSAASSNHLSSSHKERRPRSPPPAARSTMRGGELPRDRKREDSRERDKSRRIEDRLGPSPSQTTRRSPALRSRNTRRAASPRDKRSSR